jgi:isopenicillin N synthase-like dioxygenase
VRLASKLKLHTPDNSPKSSATIVTLLTLASFGGCRRASSVFKHGGNVGCALDKLHHPAPAFSLASSIDGTMAIPDTFRRAIQHFRSKSRHVDSLTNSNGTPRSEKAAEETYKPPPGPPPGRLPALIPVELPLILSEHRLNLSAQGWTTLTLASESDPRASELNQSLQSLFAASKKFFASPREDKAPFQTKKGSEEGWSSSPGEKEFITIRSLDKLPDELRDAVVDTWMRVGAVLNETLVRIAESLELHPSTYTKFSEPCINLGHEQTATMLRLFRYEGWEDKTVAEPHNDLGLLSFVAGDTPGLEVWDPNGQSFFPIEKTYVKGQAGTVLVGRQLQRFTNRRYIPGGHQVRSYAEYAPENLDHKKYRYSIVFVLRAHSPVIVNTDEMTSRITGEHAEPIRGMEARELFANIRNAHYNINTGIEAREKQKRDIEIKKLAAQALGNANGAKLPPAPS